MLLSCVYVVEKDHDTHLRGYPDYRHWWLVVRRFSLSSTIPRLSASNLAPSSAGSPVQRCLPQSGRQQRTF